LPPAWKDACHALENVLSIQARHRQLLLSGKAAGEVAILDAESLTDAAQQEYSNYLEYFVHFASP
jgi:hypothetical protein